MLPQKWGWLAEKRVGSHEFSRRTSRAAPEIGFTWGVIAQNATRSDQKTDIFLDAGAHALRLLVEDRMTDEAIARQVGVCRRTLGYWKTHPDFIAAAERMVAAYAAELRRDAIRRLRF